MLPRIPFIKDTMVTTHAVHTQTICGAISVQIYLYGAISSYIGTYIVGTGFSGTNIVHVHPIDLRYTIGI